jgi:hypothetical protein
VTCPRCYAPIVRDQRILVVGALPLASVGSAFHYLTGLVPSFGPSFPQSPPEAKATFLLNNIAEAALRQSYLAMGIAVVLAASLFIAREHALRRALRLATATTVVVNLSFFGFVLVAAAGIAAQF